ncbi:MAG: cell envelope integrity protein TolA [Bdellovibrionales bacterium]|nr:cell envelope integrity protein TolA [Bdellovibrionales bacterium]
MKFYKLDRTKISYSFIFSLILHVGFVAFTVKKTAVTNAPVQGINLPVNAQKVTSIKLDSIKFISPKELNKIKNSQGTQVVANEARGKNERPESSRFLGEKDQTFERQTMAKNNGSFKEAGFGKKDGSKSTLSQEQTAAPTPPKKVAEAKPKMPKKDLSLSDLGTFTVSDAEKIEKSAKETLADMTKKMAQEKHLGAEGVEAGKVGTTGLAQNNDFVEEVPLGDMTNLNTTEFKYYGFYHRIRQKLEQHWGSSIKDKAKNLYRSGRRMPASENLITSVTVTLDDHGQIVDMTIEGTSGVRELDQAAIESFNKAGPFPNPPKGLLVGGRATIQWGFVVKS